jgi:GT2 family glycosyltransferase
VTLNEGPRLRTTVEALRSTLPAESEIIVVDDGSTDRSSEFLSRELGLGRMVRCRNMGSPRARNLGAAQAGGDILVFCDAHMEFPRDWWRGLAEAVQDPKVAAAAPAIADMEYPDNAGYGMTIPEADLTARWLPQRKGASYPVPILPGACWAMRRAVFEATGGFDEGLVRWGSEDVEYSLRLWLLGYALLLLPEVHVGHLFRDSGADRPYEVAWGWVQHNKLRLALIHLNAHRQAKVVDALRAERGFKSGWRMARNDGIAGRRAALEQRRRHDDEWLFRKFDLSW